MNIEIYGLNPKYIDQCKAMDAKIYPLKGVIDVNFPQDVEMRTDVQHKQLFIYSPKNSINGMLINFGDYFTITIN